MQNHEIAGNRDTGLLKIIALVCMIVDHVGARLLPQTAELRIVGRIAFPLYIWCLVVGACHTRSPLKYALRLLAVGLISQPCFMLGLHHRWNQWNIYATLLLGYLGIWGIRENRFGSRWWAPLLVLAVPCYIQTDYDWRGVLLIMLLYLARERRGAVAAVMTAFCLFWGSLSYSVPQVFGLQLSLAAWPEILRALMRLQGMALLALPLILWPRRERTPFPKAVAYAVYPGHLLLLWAAQLLLKTVTWQESMALLFP